MIVDLTARFDYDTGWSYLFIVYCRSGRFGQSSCFGHVTAHSQLGHHVDVAEGVDGEDVDEVPTTPT